jgi:hypothetical protein
MPKTKGFRHDKVRISPAEVREEVWEFGGGRKVRGEIARYEVVDSNFRPAHRWEFDVATPHRLAGSAYIEVQPVTVPPVESWSTLKRRSVCFRRATYWPDFVYAEITLSDPTGAKNRLRLPAGQRDVIKPYLSLRNVRDKATVTSVAGRGPVWLCRPSSHRSMIRFYMATRAWPLYNGVVVIKPPRRRTVR